jgi:hypothetical protein
MTWRSSEDDENKLPSPMPFPAWERVRVRAARLLPSGVFEGEGWGEGLWAGH